MSVKKNLTVATLAALLAVPAFGATNFSKAVHMPSVTAHADNYLDHEPTVTGQNLVNRVRSLGGTWDNSNDTEHLNYGGT